MTQESRQEGDGLGFSLEHVLRALVEASPIAIVATDTEMTVRLWNPAAERIFGWTASEIVGQPYPLAPEADQAILEQLRQRVAQGETLVGLESRRQRKDGSFVEVRSYVTPLLNSRKRVIGYLAMLDDLTEERRLYRQFLQAQKMEAIGRLAGGVAHDFNNQLTTILGYADMLLDETDKDRPLWGDLQEIKKAAERSSALTRQLLAFSRRQVLRFETVDLNGAVQGVEKMLARLLGEDIRMIFSFSDEALPVRADVSQLEHVLTNLLVNARDAMPSGGAVTIETEQVDLHDEYVHTPSMPRGVYARLTVQDTGHGMDRDTQAHIFEPFFTTKPKGQGTGLGLSTVYGIVKQMDGYVWVYSEPGSGTTFRIYFPLSTEPLTRKLEPAPLASPTGSEHILLVEDEAGVRTLATKVLERHGYSVVAAATPVEALAHANAQPNSFDMIVTDVVLPEMSGPALIDRLRAVQPRARVIYTSGYADTAHLGGPAVLGDLVEKPFTADTLLRKIREMLDR